MDQQCPKCHAHLDSPVQPECCPHCGVYFAKYHAAQLAPPTLMPVSVPGPGFSLRDWLWPDTVIDPSTLLPRILLLGVLIVWGLWFITRDWDGDDVLMNSFMHKANLPFHEFGHILFRPFGRWLMFLGGSLFQCLLPLLLGGVFLIRQRDAFAAAVTLWWCGQNLLDVTPYIADASAMQLSLTGEYTDDIVAMRPLRHDWHNILEPLGLLHADVRIAATVHWLGVGVMFVSWCWAGSLLWQARRPASSR